jgi:GTP-binding protein
VADVPGLIEGAHAGHGLGDRFLKHLERTKVLVHLVDVSGASGRDPVEDFETVRRELTLFAPALGLKPQLVVANKVDALDEPDRVARLKARADALSMPFYAISGATGEGVDRLLEAAWERVASTSEVSALDVATGQA